MVVASHFLIHLVNGTGGSCLTDLTIHAVLTSGAPVVKEDTIGMNISVIFMHLGHRDELAGGTLDFVLLVHALPEARLRNHLVLREYCHLINNGVRFSCCWCSAAKTNVLVHLNSWSGKKSNISVSQI